MSLTHNFLEALNNLEIIPNARYNINTGGKLLSCCVISGSVLVCFPVAVINTMTKRILWRKGLMSTYTSRSQSTFERSQDRNSSRSSGGMLLTAPSDELTFFYSPGLRA